MHTAGNEEVVSEGEMVPVSLVVAIDDTTHTALAGMDATGLDFIPVVDGAGEFAGVVLRRGIERGCRGMGHEPESCMVLNHLKRNVRSHRVGEPFDRGMRAPFGREPVIVLSDRLAPIGILELAG